MRITRRGLQSALGALWFLDGILQLQPFMLGRGFADQIIRPAGDGQPEFVAAPVHWAAAVIAAHPVAWDVPFAAVQLLIGVGLLVPRTARVALAASIGWALGVWYFGEGLSGLASGHASLLTGAPGSALLYALLGAAAWPRRDRTDEAPARWLRYAWVVLWAGAAVLQALPGQNTGASVAGEINAPGSLQLHLGRWITDHGTLVVIGLVTLVGLVGLGILRRRTFRLAAAAGLALSAVIWVIGQDLGQLWSGQATDPNSAPLIALMAIALLGTQSARLSPACGAAGRMGRRSGARAEETLPTPA
jgi:hypothetical protein